MFWRNVAEIKGPKSGRMVTVLATGTSLDQGQRAIVLDQLLVIASQVIPQDIYNLLTLSETDGLPYTVAKQHVHICLKSRHDFNTLVYVMLHELAHVVAKTSIQHDDMFVKTFKDLQATAIAKRLYQKTDYLLKPALYCGKVINSAV